MGVGLDAATRQGQLLPACNIPAVKPGVAAVIKRGFSQALPLVIQHVDMHMC